MSEADRAARRAELRRAYRERRARELEDDGELEAAAELRAGRCACTCRNELGGAVRAFYVDQRHRQRHHRARLRRLAEAAGVPTSLSVQALQARESTRDRNGDAPARRKRAQRRPRPGVTLYLPSLNVADALAVVMGDLVQLDTTPELEVAREALEVAIARRRRREASTSAP
jgi:hypothetical protein